MGRRNALVMKNAGLAYFWALKFVGLLEWDDLIQVAWMGLVRAAATYQPEKSAFSTYASYWVRRLIVRAIQQQQKTIRIPVHLWKGITPPEEHHAAHNEEEVKRVVAENNPEEDAHAAQLREEVDRLLHSLEPREREIAVGLFLHDDTLQAVGDRLGLTRERVRQLQNDIKAKLRERTMVGAHEI